ncbi:DUF4244 domain-containing protein [Aestuariimicrobium soli]|uniref:DUF4244 domain-containing protein n=1 Tax=Aestuariimicrobium soli TaxID=2035834 RepID=UPI003EBD34CF
MSEIDLLDTQKYAPAPKASARHEARLTRLAQRGLSTAEYAIGILGVIAFALVVYTTFGNSKIAEGVLQLVMKAIKHFAGKI